MSKIIKSEEVAKHKTKTSTWVIIHNNIYNLTKFLDEHPGGADSILDFAGKDGTVAFEDVGHSQDARDMMKKYKIGALPPDEHTTNKTRRSLGRANPVASSKKKDCDSCSIASCPILLSKSQTPENKSWRTYDGSSSSVIRNPKPSVPKLPSLPTVLAARRACSARRLGERGYGSSGSGDTWKYALLAIAGLVLTGFIVKKYVLK